MATRPKIGFKRVRAEAGQGMKAGGYAMWDGCDKRPPRKGELFLSGCEGYEMAYLAKQDLTQAYFICRRIVE